MPRYRRCSQPGCHAMVAFPNHYCTKHFEHEAEYLANRQRWARKHAEQYQHHEQHYNHHYNVVTRNRSEERSDQYKFYRSRQWVGLRQSTLDRDHYLCQYCKACGKLTPNSKTVDHIVPIAYDSSIMASKDNLATICRECHRLKTQWEEKYYFIQHDVPNRKTTELHDVNIVARLIRKM